MKVLSHAASPTGPSELHATSAIHLQIPPSDAGSLVPVVCQLFLSPTHYIGSGLEFLRSYVPVPSYLRESLMLLQLSPRGPGRSPRCDHLKLHDTAIHPYSAIRQRPGSSAASPSSHSHLAPVQLTTLVAKPVPRPRTPSFIPDSL